MDPLWKWEDESDACTGGQGREDESFQDKVRKQMQSREDSET